ncbi:MAG: PKD domain-containing protein [Candidatus Bipolaricaulis sp.]|nr:PKD domain-containing protein [Candidatus Bipolaricaulis sp.]
MTKTRRIAHAVVLLVGVGLMAAAGAAQTPRNSSPVASFSAFLAQGSGATVEFDASASSDSDGRIVTYQWVFGDGSTGSGIVKDHVYTQIDRYDVTLLVIDDAGATAMVTRTIDIEDLPPRSTRSPKTAAPTPTVGVSTAQVGNRVGMKAPDFSIPGTDSANVRLSDYAGQVVLLEFWMSACPACQASMSGLEALRVRYESQGFVVIVVSIEQTATGANDFLVGAGYTEFISAIDIYWPTRPTRAAYGVGHVPHTFLIDRDGVIRYSGSPGNLTPAAVEAWI